MGTVGDFLVLPSAVLGLWPLGPHANAAASSPTRPHSGLELGTQSVRDRRPPAVRVQSRRRRRRAASGPGVVSAVDVLATACSLVSTVEVDRGPKTVEIAEISVNLTQLACRPPPWAPTPRWNRAGAVDGGFSAAYLPGNFAGASRARHGSLPSLPQRWGRPQDRGPLWDMAEGQASAVSSGLCSLHHAELLQQGRSSHSHLRNDSNLDDLSLAATLPRLTLVGVSVSERKQTRNLRGPLAPNEGRNTVPESQ
ncbi:uncharacterized protein BDZ99DRAFT_517388 [Mytilinidion resinicola]|uniref:Uncharacterized protein n=1 Tax=Mytilinidion resinicola TaxID=574789 RepID=A0A6A6YWE9_9PEZI|nr:uncharacterized protein BDZ99DRAFT_517388 [Mytilinidion resinicola]KAF2813100.1 hypothetical protein BDZ99DRAFT_517388 [Mytilinidion resinicola]